MSKEKVSFLDSSVYPVLFMLILTIVFVGLLSVFYRSTEKGIAIRKQQTYQMQILTMFADTLSTVAKVDKAKLSDINNLNANFKQYITEKEIAKSKDVAVSPKYFEATSGKGVVLGYCFDVTGSGLWGTMHGLLAVTPDFKHIINFIIYDQMETPGLGARVTEPWFRNQFARKPLITNNSFTSFSLVPEGGQPSSTQVRQITGATITSSSTLKIIQTAALELNKDFDLKVK